MRWLKLLVVGLIAGCSTLAAENEPPAPVRKALENPDSFVLYSLDPKSEGEGNDAAEADDSLFHGYPVLGKIEIEDAAERKKLENAFLRGVAESDGTVAGCFIPRHGIRVTQGKSTIDLVICFQCLSTTVYIDGERSQGFLLTKSPQPVFDAVLRSANIPLAKAAE
jgi:hypothetical protein